MDSTRLPLSPPTSSPGLAPGVPAPWPAPALAPVAPEWHRPAEAPAAVVRAACHTLQQGGPAAARLSAPSAPAAPTGQRH